MPQATSDLTTSMETRVEHTTDKTNLPSSSDISSYAQTSHAAESSEDTESTEGELTMILLFEFEL